jgi:glycosyltransferase involved in cell wall biosynthesis
MTDASAFIHHIRAIPVLKYGMSSNKLADYMAAGRPIICAVSASNDPVKEADAGISIPPEDPEAMAQAILKLVAMSPEDRIRMGKNARGYAERNYDTRILAAKLESTYLTVLSEKGARRRRPF